VDLAQLDELLRRYGDAEQRIAANLVELEDRPTFGLLQKTPWRGVSAERIGPAVALAAALWQSFQSFRDLLVDARTRRGTGRRLDDTQRQSLEVLLTGPSVLVDSSLLPAEERTLLGPTAHETWRTLDQMLEQMSADYDTVSNAVGAVEAAWRDLVPALDRANGAINAAIGTAGPALAGDPAVTTVRDQVATIERALADDPLGLAPSTLSQLDAAVAIVRERAARLAGATAAWTAGLQRADALLVSLRADVASTRAALGEAQAKIAAPAGLVDPPTEASIETLDRQLVALRAGNDANALARLEGWLARAEDQAATVSSARAANRAPLDRRNELRGLLSAYQAKAGAAGRLEDDRIGAVVRAAEQELYRAPTNLDRAAQLVEDLGTALRTAREPR
jgi:hypothetical protein